MLDLVYIISVCLSAIIFMVLNQKLMKYLRPKSMEDNKYVDWKWRNILTSLFHSFIVGFGVLLVIISERSLPTLPVRGCATFLNAYESSAGNAFICVSTGYFVYDLVLSLTNLHYPGRIEIIVHHVITLLCLVVSLARHQFLAYCVVGLTVEISSFFLHIRELLTLSGVSKLSKTYCLNSAITILTLVMFRFVPLSWITYGIYEERQHIELALILMAILFLTIIFSVSSVLLYRVITTDYSFNVIQDLMQLIGINSNKFQCKCSSKLRKIL